MAAVRELLFEQVRSALREHFGKVHDHPMEAIQPFEIPAVTLEPGTETLGDEMMSGATVRSLPLVVTSLALGWTELLARDRETRLLLGALVLDGAAQPRLTLGPTTFGTNADGKKRVTVARFDATARFVDAELDGIA